MANSKIVLNENLETMIAGLQDQEVNEIHVEGLDEVTDFILDHSMDDRKTIGMLDCVRAMRTLMIEIGRAAADKEQ